MGGTCKVVGSVGVEAGQLEQELQEQQLQEQELQEQVLQELVLQEQEQLGPFLA